MSLRKIGIKKIIIIIFVIIIAGSLIAYFIFNKGDKTEYITAKVERGSIKQTVSETGTVKASSEINLNFLNSGRIANIFVKIGEMVKSDQVLAELDYSDLAIKKQEAQANLDAAKAKLAKFLAGASNEEIAVNQASADQARVSYEAAVRELEKVKSVTTEDIAQAEKTLSDLELDTNNDITTYEQAIAVAQVSLSNAKSTYQRIIDNEKADSLTAIEDKLSVAAIALDTITIILDDSDAKKVLSIKNTFYLEQTKANQEKATNLLATADISLTAAKENKTDDNVNQALNDAIAAFNNTFTALNNCYNALEYSIITSDFTQAELNSFKSNVSADLTLISLAISTIQTARQDLADAILDFSTNIAAKEEDLKKAQVALDNAIITAKNSLATVKLLAEQKIIVAEVKVNNNLEAWQVAKAKLSQIKAPSRIEDISLARAQVEQAQAALNLNEVQINNSIIKAPINGTITKIEYEIGEQVTSAQTVISVLAENNFEVEVLISEADIAKIKINDLAEITLDAFGEDVKFTGKVYFIEPAETVIQEVIYYKIIIQFTPLNDKQAKGDDFIVKSGMTANVVITTAQRDDIFIMPSRAVIEKNGGGKTVRLLTNGQISNLPITLGLRGDEGMVEVLSGVKEGDEVVTFIKEDK